ncbi:hypothetical protein [Bacillus canaveralius]|uniref:hypothetical protein n=1 Tax=Bacillus canaveralius TaxID=1403243 RepID=UPI00115A7A27|nr:hypothetical protein [Bacillus canaveralius]
MLRLGFIFLLNAMVLLLFPISFALADAGHTGEKSIIEDTEAFRNGNQGLDGEHSGHSNQNVHEQHNGKADHEAEHTDPVDDSGETVHSEEGTHGHADETVIETPPNYKVLGTFGAINFSFLIAGLWNKRLRKKVQPHVDARKKA